MANKANLANSFLAAPVSDTDTTLTVENGDGALFPATPFYATLTEKNKLSRFTNSEIVEVTDVTGDVLTINRAQRGTSALEFAAGDIVANGIYVEDLIELAENIDQRGIPSGGTEGQVLIKSSDADYAVEWGDGARDALSPEIQFAGGKVGIGKVPENGALDVDGDIYSNGAKVAIEDDTGWITPTLLSPFKVYNVNPDLVVPVRYRRIRSVVYLEGTIQPTSASTNIDTTNGDKVFTLPVGFRPSTDNHVWVCQGSNRALWILQIYRSGDVYAARYRTDWASYSEPGTNAWFPFSVSFVVD